MVILGAIIVLRRFNRITAVSALRSGGEPEAPRGRRGLPLRLAARSNLNLFLGVRDAILRFRLFGLQTFIFFFAAAAALVPIHVLSTMRSEAFITYMGIGRSDIRIDLRQTTSAAQRLHEITGRLATDDDVARFAPLITSQFILLRQSGEVETFAVETGNLDQFPLEYLKGRAPKAEDEIALSYLNSQDLEKSLGDTILLRDNVSQRRLEVVGIYQDITHGGRTAKGVFSHNEDEVVALSVSLDLLPGISVDKKVREYSQLFDPARVTALDSYLRQTLGNTIAQLARVSIGAVILGLLISLLITSLFLRMLISKDSRRIAVMKSIGFSVRDLRLQYLTTSLLLLLIGFGGGTLFSNTLGQDLASFFWSFLGAAEIDFIIDPVLAYLVVPLLLMGTVAATTLATVGAIKEQTVAATIAE
jgi:putative ABC transport system permease protein